MKKSLLIFLSLLLVALLAFISISHANMFNRFKKGFYFEKYSTVEEAKAELLKLHPIGSDVVDLVKTLEVVGAAENTPINKEDNGGWEYIKINDREIYLGTFTLFRYEHNRIFSIFPRRWVVIIEKKDSKILNIFTSYQQGV